MYSIRGKFARFKSSSFSCWFFSWTLKIDWPVLTLSNTELFSILYYSCANCIHSMLEPLVSSRERPFKLNAFVTIFIILQIHVCTDLYRELWNKICLKTKNSIPNFTYSTACGFLQLHLVYPWVHSLHPSPSLSAVRPSWLPLYALSPPTNVGSRVGRKTQRTGLRLEHPQYPACTWIDMIL